MLTKERIAKIMEARNTLLELYYHNAPVGDTPNLLTAAQKTVMDVQRFDMATDAYTMALASGNQQMIDMALTQLDNALIALEGDRGPVDAGFAALGINS